MGRMDAPARCRELGEEMRRRREASGRTAADVARWTDWSASKISRAESGKVLLSEVDLIHYLAACRIFVVKARDLLDLRRDAENRPGYWMRPHQSLQSLVYHESEARESVTYERQVICGLLQTEEYATAIVESMNDPHVDTRCAVRIRLDRQRIVCCGSPDISRWCTWTTTEPVCFSRNPLTCGITNSSFRK